MKPLWRELVENLRCRGPRKTLAGLVKTLLSPLVRHRERLIWEADLNQPRTPSAWRAGERLLIVGPHNAARELTPGLVLFLGDETAAKDIEGVRRGDLLFVVADASGYLACSYIFFPTTAATRRQTRIMGEKPKTPIIGLSFTAPAARGRGIYQRILNAMFLHLRGMGYQRAICEVEPRNTPSNRASAAAGMRVCSRQSEWIFLRRLLVQNVRGEDRRGWRFVRI